MHSKVTAPVLTDKTLDLAFAVKYFIFSVFGAVGAASTVPAISVVGGAVYELFWTISIFLVSLAATALVLYNLFHQPTKWNTIKLEFYTTIGVVFLVGTYSGALITLALQGSDTRYSLAVISLSLLVFPVWRLRQLWKKLK